MVKDIKLSSPFSQETESIYRVGDKIFFLAADAVHGQELWVSDGSAAGTHMVKDVIGGNDASWSAVRMLGQTDGLLLFTVNSAGLWRSDGTAEGTFKISGVTPQQCHMSLGLLWFEAVADPALGIVAGVWCSDGTAEGTRALPTPAAPAPLVGASSVVISPPGAEIGPGSRFATIADSVYFRTANYHILGFNKTTGITRDFGLHLPTNEMQGGGNWASVTTGNPNFAMAWHAFRGDGNGFIDLAPDQAWSSIRCAGSLGSIHFMVGRAISDHRWSLWRSDGSRAGTWMVKQLPDSESSPVPYGFTAAGGRIFFVTDDEKTGREAWVTDGSADGTRLLKEFRKGKYGSDIRSFYPDGNSVYFGASDGARHAIWKSDGSLKGTVRFLPTPKDVMPRGIIDGDPPVVMDNIVYFAGARHRAGSNQGALTLWRSDGTTTGTYSLTGAEPGNSRPDDGDASNGIHAVGDSVVFRAWDSDAGVLWKSDGTEAGTFPLEARPKKFDGDWGARNPCALGGQVFFVNMETSGKKRRTIFSSDGTELSAGLIPGITAKAYPTGITKMVRSGEWVYMHTERFVWATGGNKQNTFKLVDISTLGQKIEAETLMPLGGEVIFSTGSLWKANAETRAVEKIIDSSALGFHPLNLRVVGETLYFSGWREGSFQLWRSDGTLQGTGKVKSFGFTGELKNFTSAGGVLWFTYKPHGSALELWTSDGSPAGTKMVAAVPVEFGLPSEGPGGQLFFRAWSQATGNELWASDGTAAGTGLVKDIYQGGASSMVTGITRVGDHAYFAATHPVHGRELWKTDGTAEGTVLAVDLTGDAGSSSPNHLVLAGSRLFFDATTAEAGREVRVLDVSADLAK